MKFKKDGKVFDNIRDAKEYYCDTLSVRCEGCVLYDETCTARAEKDPPGYARLMGFEIIEDEPVTQELPLDIRGMTLRQAKEYCANHKNAIGDDLNCENHCKFRTLFCGMTVDNWKLNRRLLTPDELEICRKIGAKWASKDRHKMSNIEFWKDKPVLSEDGFTYSGGERVAYLPSRCFPSLKPGDCICVDDLIKDDA